MPDDARNVLLIMSDEHRPDALSVADHDVVETPNLDRLAASGTRFANAYCPSPLCAPCRGAFVTGRYVHDVGAWDNAASYGGGSPTWPEHLSERGVHTTNVGKLDFRPGVEVYDEQLDPGYRGSPDVNGLQRDPPNVRESARERILSAGAVEDGLAGHEEADGERTDIAVDWLEEHAGDEAPWVLSLNYTMPHFPLRAGREYYDRYVDEVGLPDDYPAGDDHPIMEELRDHFDGRGIDEETLRRTRAAYYALCSRLDEYVGDVLDALERLGLAEETLVVYTADHGEPLGDHETWWKCNMYEPSVGVPLVARGPGVGADRVVEDPVSLLDLVPTIADAVGVERSDEWRGDSLSNVLSGGGLPDDTVAFSEYHAHGTSCGAFMLRQGEYKYVYYPDNPDWLFDRGADPRELENLADDPEHADVRERLHDRLLAELDEHPDEIDERARADQRRRREQPVEEWW